MQDPEEQLDLFGENPRAVKAIDWRGDGQHPLDVSGEMPEGLYLGTSSWSFPGWDGLVYDGSYSEQRLADKGLEAYAQCPLFRCVSLDKSYYRPPDEAEYERLASQVPSYFRFVVKTPRELLVPQPRSGFDLEKLSRIFLAPAARGLGQTLGVILLQFPPGSWKSVGSPSGFCQHLGRLFRSLPAELSYSLEVRDDDLLTAELGRTMEGTPVSLCASIHPRMPSVEKQLLAVPPTPGTPLVFRWNLRPSLEYEEAREELRPFNALKMPDGERRNRLAHLIARALRAGRTVYATANNKAEGCAPLSMRALLDEVVTLSSHLEEISSSNR